MNKKVICFGEVLWDDFGSVKTIGGAPLNVCYHLSKMGLGQDPVIVSRVGNDALGGPILEQIKNWQIEARYCSRSNQHPTSTVKVHILPHEQVNYTITESVAWDFIEYDEQLASEIAVADAFIYGTLAARSPVSRNTLLRYATMAKWPILDLNHRDPYGRKEVVLPLLATCKSLKLNEHELIFITALLNGEGKTEKDQITGAFEAFPNIEEIILTKGGAGAAYYLRNAHCEVKGISVEVADTVGSGDSFLAAFVGGRLKRKTSPEILNDAILLSAFIATRVGGCPAYDMRQLENFKNKHDEVKN